MSANDTPTSFPDDELKRLKVWVTDNPHEDDDGLNIRGTKRLLTRLEAAEAVMKRSALWHDGECEIMNGVMRTEEECDCGSYESHKNWLKAVGKLEIAE